MKQRRDAAERSRSDKLGDSGGAPPLASSAGPSAGSAAAPDRTMSKAAEYKMRHQKAAATPARRGSAPDIDFSSSAESEVNETPRLTEASVRTGGAALLAASSRAAPTSRPGISAALAAAATPASAAEQPPGSPDGPSMPVMIVEGTPCQVRSNTPIRDTGHCCHPLNPAPYLRFGPPGRRGVAEHLELHAGSGPGARAHKHGL